MNRVRKDGFWTFCVNYMKDVNLSTEDEVKSIVQKAAKKYVKQILDVDLKAKST